MSEEAMTRHDVLELLDATMRAAVRSAGRLPKLELRPGTVNTYLADGTALVHLDGDPPGNQIGARNSSGRLASFDRVNVEFVPGGTAIIRGRRTDDVAHVVGADVSAEAIEPPYGANWQKAPGFDGAIFRRDSAGNVHLGGVVRWTGGAGLAPLTTIFVLPLGYAPTAWADGTVRTRGPWVVSSGGGGSSQVTINSDGNVVYRGGTSPEIAVALDGVIFDPGLASG